MSYLSGKRARAPLRLLSGTCSRKATLGHGRDLQSAPGLTRGNPLEDARASRANGVQQVPIMATAPPLDRHLSIRRQDLGGQPLVCMTVSANVAFVNDSCWHASFKAYVQTLSSSTTALGGAAFAQIKLPNKRCWPKSRRPKRHSVMVQTGNRLPALRKAILSRTHEQAVQMVCSKSRPWQLRHLLVVICQFDVKTLPATPLACLSKEDIAFDLVYRWAPLTKDDCQVQVAAVLSSEQIERVKEESARNYQRLLDNPPDWNITKSVWSSRRCYLRIRAWGMVRRGGGSHADMFRILMGLTWKDEDVVCHYCGIPTTFIRELSNRKPHFKPLEEFTVYPANFSPDRRIPARLGGRYEAGNVVSSCLGCNMLKGGLRADTAQKLLRHVANDQSFEIDERGFLNPIRDDDLGPLTAKDHRRIEAWATKAHHNVGSRLHRRASMDHDLTLEDIVGLARELYVGQGKYVDPCGARLPLKFAEIDRIDPTVGYTKGNCRLLFAGLNWLRNKSANGWCLAEYLSALKAQLRGRSK